MSILFCTPMYGGNCHHAYFKSALNLKEYLTQQGVPHDFYTLYNESAVHRARNQCVKAFLETDFEYMMFIDGDIEFTLDDVGRLWNIMGTPTGTQPTDIAKGVNSNLVFPDVAVGLYRMKKDDAPFAAWVGGKLITIEDLPEHRNVPFEVDYAGTGFMLIRRDVLERMCTEDNLYEGADGPMHQVFDFPLRNGVELSEDYAFCEDVRNSGGKVIMDPNVRLVHWGIKAY